MDRCPACQARLREPAVCARCQTDLSLAIAAEAAAEESLRQALESWAAGARPAARQALEQSISLKREPLALVLRDCLDRER
jgi:hypothetical protein